MILWTDKATFIGRSLLNIYNKHVWSHKSSYAMQYDHFLYDFLVTSGLESIPINLYLHTSDHAYWPILVTFPDNFLFLRLDGDCKTADCFSYMVVLLVPSSFKLVKPQLS